MEFGHLDEILENIDFTLPVDTERNARTLSNSKTDDPLRVFIGGTKWTYKSWIGSTYPPRSKNEDFLKEYSKNFNSIEFGPTFYKVANKEEIAAWVNQIVDKDNFQFSPKFPQSITHIRRLRNADDITKHFYDGLNGFGNQLGPLLLQLSEAFSPKSFNDLENYLGGLPSEQKVFVEVRHKDWFGVEENRTRLYNLLQRLNMGWVISDTAGRRDCVHMELTKADVLIRFLGDGIHPSTFARLEEWVSRIKIWKGHGLQNIWFFMHNHEEKQVPLLCDYLIRALNKELGVNLKPPRLEWQGPNDELF
jgi:uncharacterized protein YecE (DUF72 family)